MNIPATERDKRRMCINIYLYTKSSCSLSNEMQGPRSSLLTDLERFSAQDHKKKTKSAFPTAAVGTNNSLTDFLSIFFFFFQNEKSLLFSSWM